MELDVTWCISQQDDIILKQRLDNSGDTELYENAIQSLYI